MTAKNRTTLKAEFQIGDIPDGNDFSDFIDSFINLTDTATQTVTSSISVTGSFLASGVASSSTLAVGVQTLAGIGTIQGTAAQITSSYVVATNGASDRAYLLPTTAGTIVIFRNSGANTAKIFPPVGGQIDALGANASLDVTTGNKTMIVCESSTVYASYAV